MERSKYPLRNLRVINFGWVWAAPVLGGTLGDMGAEVIKIETRKRPDIVRVLPPLLGEQPLESMYGHTTLRSNLGISLDLATQKGRDIAKELVKSADIVIENSTPKVMPRLGLDYTSLRRIRPDLIMISLSAAGQTGPLADITTYGSIISCLAGLDGHQGYIGRAKPSRYGTTIPDPLMGVFGAFAVLAALRHRTRTGQGQYIDLSQWEACVTLLGGPMMDYAMNQRIQYPRGNRDEMMAPHGVYPTKPGPSSSDGHMDRWVTIAVKTDVEWRKLCETIGRPDLAEDERFGDTYSRQEHHDEIDQILSAWTRDRDNMDVTGQLQAIGVAAFPAMSSKELFDDPHFKERGDWVEVMHPTLKQKEIIYGVPWKLSKTPGGVQRPAPVIGQHNHMVYHEVLGLPNAQVAALEKEGVFQ